MGAGEEGGGPPGVESLGHAARQNREAAPVERRRGEELIAHLHRGGWLGQPEYYDPESIIEQFHDLTASEQEHEATLVPPDGFRSSREAEAGAHGLGLRTREM